VSRVAIIGSCITRDLWPIRGDGVEGLLYISRTSLPSLFARPLAGFTPAQAPPGGLTKYQHQAVTADLLKSALASLVAHRPTHIIFDFIDERFDLLSTGETLVTHSWELEQTGYRASPALARARLIPRTSEACLLLWRGALGELAGFIGATPLAQAQIILHQSRWASRYLDESRRQHAFDAVQIWDGKPARVDQQNDLLETYETLFQEAFPQAQLVAAPDQRVADATHRWGLSPFHYCAAYYSRIWAGLEAAGISPAGPEAQATPSAPAASAPL
jgi:hypothetical protein